MYGRITGDSMVLSPRSKEEGGEGGKSLAPVESYANLSTPPTWAQVP